MAIGDLSANFAGRGYHDHNAGAEEMSLAMRRWEWGRVHIGDQTHIYYASTPQPGKGEPQSLWITCVDGRPEEVRDDGVITQEKIPEQTVFGIRHSKERSIDDGHLCLTRKTDICLDDGPFYRRWVAGLRISNAGGDIRLRHRDRRVARHPPAEPWYVNWMIPYRLKWPVHLTNSGGRAKFLSAVQADLRRVLMEWPAWWADNARARDIPISWRKRMLVLSRKQFEGIQIGTGHPDQDRQGRPQPGPAGDRSPGPTS